MKRVFDFVGAAISLLLLVPFLLSLVLLLWLLDPGPALFKQERVGRNGRLFRMLKFRTMRADVGATQDLAVSGDARITPFGHLLRATKIDELPQLINVLKGEMSFVGPRPLIPQQVDLNDPAQREITTARPGITSPAAIIFRDEARLLRGANVDEYVRRVLLPAKRTLNLYYVRHRSLGMDLRLVALTLIALIAPVSPFVVVDWRKVVGHHAMDARSDPSADNAEVDFSGIASIERAFRAARPSVAQAIGKRVRRFAPSLLTDLLTIAFAIEAVAAVRAPDFAAVTVALRQTAPAALVAGALFCALSYLSGLHRRIWRYAGAADFAAIVRVAAITTCILALVQLVGLEFAWNDGRLNTTPVIVFGGMFLATLLLCCEKAIPWLLAGRTRGRANQKPIRVLIVGAGQAGAAVAARLQLNRAFGYEVVAFLDDADEKRDRQIQGVPIVGAIETLTTVVVPLAIDMVVVAIPSVGNRRLSEILALCGETEVAVEIHSGLPRPGVSPPQPRSALPIAQQADGQGLSSVG